MPSTTAAMKDPMYRLTMRIAALLFGLMYLPLSTAKKLVLFAGPHKAASASVETFFYNHASGYEGTNIADGLQGWLWPKVTKDLWVDNHVIDKREIFNVFVTQASNTTAQIILRQAIQDSWDASEYGIIIGTPEFDRVGLTPFTNRNGVLAMKGILDQVGVGPHDVTVVLNYRSPRRDQWISMWKHEDVDNHYKRFICKGNENELKEVLDTAMNPLKLAVEYRKQGWKVVLMDMSGINAMGKDISHAIACDVLEHTTCEGGFVVPIVQTYNENDGGDKDLHSLHDQELNDMDQLFRERDCYYDPLLSNDDGFEILYRDTIWQGCIKANEQEQKTQQELYQHLIDPGFLLGALKEQKGCSSVGSKMKNILVGDYNSMVVSTISVNDNDAGVIGAEDSAKEDAEMEDSKGDFQSPENPSLTPKRGRHHSPWLITFLVLMAVGFGIFQLTLMQRRNSRGVHVRARNQEFEDAQGQELDEIPGDHWSKPSYWTNQRKPSYWTDPPKPSYWKDPPEPSYPDGDII